ncbi:MULTISPECIES: PrsW family intramembrane metalloprotease [Halobacterium]|uniref:PrsW family intramembrane metalloprotease n=1 Tax=Halobacterium TaxID=2239 RepID=UPI00073EBEE0|nr:MULTISPECIES: PrsW family intramembrane metalloprotease [Halobacterium]MCG1001980.1 PrsW family intramembrane metalloprotease [Halobacterium noricense]
MSTDRDPVQRANEGGEDLYDVATWEPRTTLDRFSSWLYGGIVTSARASVVALAVLIVLAQFAAALGLVFVDRPVVALYVLLSVVPALGMAAFVWKADVTKREPLELVVVTFAFGFLFAGFAAVLNTVFSGLFLGSVTADAPLWVTVLAPALYYFLIVGPVEETVKWLAIRLYAFRSDRFDAVVDGAVYGAVAGLGFATIENAIYIGREVVMAASAAGTTAAIDVGLQTAAVRTLAGPGHVIYSAFAGYYLGLAKFNPDDAGPIIVKGLVIAAVIHATYNTVVTNLGIVTDTLGLAPGLVFLGFVVVYDGTLFYVLYRKLVAYRAAYERTDAGRYDESERERTREDADFLVSGLDDEDSS